MKRGTPRLLIWGGLLLGSTLSLATEGQVGPVKMPPVKVTKLDTTEPTVSQPKMAKAKISRIETDEPTASEPRTSPVKATPVKTETVDFVGMGSGKGGAASSDQEKAIVDGAAKGDMKWAAGDGDASDKRNAGAQASNDAAGKAYGAALDAGLDRAEAEKLAGLARNKVASAPSTPEPDQPAAATPAPEKASNGLPEVLDLEAKTTEDAPAEP